MKNISKSGFMLAAGTLMLFTDIAVAEGIGGVADNVYGNFESLESLMKGVSYLGGVGFGIGAALKFKEHNENPQQVKISKPITAALVSAMLLALPSVMETSVDTVFTENATSLSIEKPATTTGNTAAAY